MPTGDLAKRPNQPLPERVRPKDFAALLGQPSIWTPHSSLFKLVTNDTFHGLLFWGPPGTGKTTLAQMIAVNLGREFIALSAVSATVKDIRAAIQHSQDCLDNHQKSVLLFMDEIHRLNKAQQDVLLPALELGTIKFIGATTENPSFEVNKAILSRILTFRFEMLAAEALLNIMQNALRNESSGYGDVKIDDEVLRLIAKSSDGDARRALNLLSAVIESHNDRTQMITVESTKEFSFDMMLKYDKAGEEHYDIISAMIKSVRASHPDAALHYLARMIESGEDLIFIARRLVILASEDVGNANPTALLVATSGMQAVQLVGYPEARIILAQMVTYLASSPKSNKSYVAIEEALSDVRKLGSLSVPMHLRNAPTQFMKSFGYGKNYKYAHDDLAGARKLTYLPEALKNKVYYSPSESGVEKQLKANLEKLRPEVD